MEKKPGRISMTRRIAAEIEQEIATGTLVPGQRLPGVRELAAKYAVSIAVSLGAYRWLEKKHLVLRRPRSGTFVAERPGMTEERRTFFSWDGVLSAAQAQELATRVSSGFEIMNYWGSQYYCVPGYIDWVDSLLSGAESRAGIIPLDEGMFPALMKQGLLLPLDEIWRKVGVPAAEFESSLLRAFRWEGRLYALPLSFSPLVLLYNRRIFEKSGVTEPVPEWSWEELLAHADRLTRIERGKIACYGLGILTDLNVWSTFILQNDGEVFDSNGNCVIDSDEAYEALNFLSRLRQRPGVCHHHFGDSRSALVDLLACGRTAMVIGNGIDYATLEQRMPQGDWGVIPLPGRRNRRGGFGVHGLGISRNCQDPEEMFRLVAQIFEPKFYRDYCRRTCVTPAWGFERYGVDDSLRQIARTGRILWLATSSKAASALNSTVGASFLHRVAFTREKCRELCAEIDAQL